MKVKSIDEIKDILETAAYVDRLLPAVRAPKYRCCMPNIIYTQQEIAFMDRRLVKPRPTQEQVSLWKKVILDWLPLLTVDEKNLFGSVPIVFLGSCFAANLGFLGNNCG